MYECVYEYGEVPPITYSYTYSYTRISLFFSPAERPALGGRACEAIVHVDVGGILSWRPDRVSAAAQQLARVLPIVSRNRRPVIVNRLCPLSVDDHGRRLRNTISDGHLFALLAPTSAFSFYL